MVLSLRNISTVNQSLLQELSDRVLTTSEVVEVMSSNVEFISALNSTLVDSLNSMQVEFSNTIYEFDSQVSNIDELFELHEKNDIRVSIVEENASNNLALTIRNSNAIEELKVELKSDVQTNLDFIREVKKNVDSNEFYTNRRLCMIDLNIISIEDKIYLNSKSINTLQDRVVSNSNEIWRNRDLIEEMNIKFDSQIDANTSAIDERFESNDARHLSTESNVSSNLDSILVLQENVASNLFLIETNLRLIQGTCNLLTATIDSNNLRFDSNDLRVSNAEYNINSNTDSILVLEANVASNLTSINTLQEDVASNLTFIERNSNAIASNTGLIEELEIYLTKAIESNASDTEERFESNDRRHLSTESNVSSNLDSILVLQEEVASNLFLIETNLRLIQGTCNLLTATIDSNNLRFDSNDLRVSNAEYEIGSNTDSILVLEANVASNLAFTESNLELIADLRYDLTTISLSNAHLLASTLVLHENVASNLSFIESNLNRIDTMSNLLTATIDSNNSRFDSNDLRVSNAEYNINSNTDSILVLEANVASNLTSINTLREDVASNLTFIERNSNAIASNTMLIDELRLEIAKAIGSNESDTEERFESNDRRHLSTESNVSSNLDSILVLQQEVASNLFLIETNLRLIQGTCNLLTATIDSNNLRFDSNDLRVSNAEYEIGSNTDSILVLEANVASNLTFTESNLELIIELRDDLESVIASNAERFDSNDIRVSNAENDIQTNSTSIITLRNDLTESIENVRINDATTTLAVGHSGTSAYTFAPQYAGDNPTLSIVSGLTVAFNLAGISGHPFKIQDENGQDFEAGLLHVATDDTVSVGLEAQGKDSGMLFWRVPEVLANVYTYQCASHRAMTGSIDVFRLVDNQLANVANDFEKEEVILVFSGGLTHSLALDSGGNVYAWGGNSRGQLGDGNGGFGVRSLAPIPVPTFLDDPNIEMRKISAGAFHNLAIDSRGDIYAWGKNEYGQLGDGTTIDRDTPVLLSSFASDPDIEIVAVSAGREFSLALDSLGRVYAWGRNNRGQLGDGTTVDKNAPVLLTTFSNESKVFTAIAAGYEHSLALDFSNNIYAWGYNLYGQLGDGTRIDRAEPTLVIGMEDIPKITSLSAGFEHSLALDAEGNVYAWGINNFGQLGNGATIDDSVTPIIVPTLSEDPNITIKAISVGDNHNFALDEEGNIYAWGRNSIGQLGDGTTTNRFVPVLLTTFADDPDVQVTSISAGNNHSLALAIKKVTGEGLGKGQGTKIVGYAWGNNNDGQLGDGTTTDNATPQDIDKITTHFENILLIGNGNSLVFTTRNVDRLYISSHNGDVGIGTGDPVEKLHVEGSILASGDITTQRELRVEGGVQVMGSMRVSESVTLDNELNVRGVITATSTSNIIPFYYPNVESFPDAATYHGAIAHAHDPGWLYYAHGGVWNKLMNASEIENVGSSQETSLSLENVRVNDAATTLAVGHSGTSAYTFAPQYTGDNPTLSIVSGMTVAFNLAGISGHPFKIQDANGLDFGDGLLHVATDDTVSVGPAAQGKDSGILFWRVPEALAGVYAYQCASHPVMTGSIDVFRLVDNQLASISDISNDTLTIGNGDSLILSTSNEDRLFIASDTGNVGIGTNTPTEKLHVSGSIYAAADIISRSDERVKSNINQITNGLEKVKRLKGYTFTFKNDEKEKKKMGVIAQEVLQVIPEVVNHDEDRDEYSVAYGNMVGVLIEAIKDLSTEVEILKKKKKDVD